MSIRTRRIEMHSRMFAMSSEVNVVTSSHSYQLYITTIPFVDINTSKNTSNTKWPPSGQQHGVDRGGSQGRPEDGGAPGGEWRKHSSRRQREC